MPVLRLISSLQDPLEVGDTGPAVRDTDQQHLGRGLSLDQKLDQRRSWHNERHYAQFLTRQWQFGLVLSIESDQAGDLPCALTCGHDIIFIFQRDM